MAHQATEKLARVGRSKLAEVAGDRTVSEFVANPSVLIEIGCCHHWSGH